MWNEHDTYKTVDDMFPMIQGLARQNRVFSLFLISAAVGVSLPLLVGEEWAFDRRIQKNVFNLIRLKLHSETSQVYHRENSDEN